MGRSTLISLNTTQTHIQTPSRMNKLLMLAFLVTLMGLMATAAPQEEVEAHELEDIAEDEYNIMEEVAESREVREARRRRKKKNPSKKRAGVRSRRLRRPSGRKSKKSKKAGGNSLQQQAARSKPRSTCRGDSDYSCALNVMNYLGLMKTQVANFLKQQGRISAFSKTGGKKDGKKGIFAATAQRIIRSGGGNSAALSCQGSTTSNGAKNLTALATLLNGCEANVT